MLILQRKEGNGPPVAGGGIESSDMINLKVSGLAADSVDNVYMTAYGNLTNYTNRLGMVFLKMDPNNNVLWSKALYSTSTQYLQGPHACGIDSSGNLYGIAFGFVPSGQGFGSSDFILTKYNTNGVHQWTRALGGTGDDRGFCIAVSDAGNVYVGGRSNTPPVEHNDDMLVAKYNTNGVHQWTSRIGGYAQDVGNGIDLDSSENVYIGGRGYEPNTSTKHALVKLNSDGQHQWDRTWGWTSSGGWANGVAVTSDGHATVVGSNGTGLTITSFNASGSLLWQKTLSATGLTQQGYGVVLDNNNNAYIVGAHQQQQGAPYSLVVARYSEAAQLDWQRQVKSDLGTIYGREIITSQIKDKIYLIGDGTPLGYIGSIYIKLDLTGGGLGEHGNIEYSATTILDTVRDTISYPVFEDQLTVVAPASPGAGFSEGAVTAYTEVDVDISVTPV